MYYKVLSLVLIAILAVSCGVHHDKTLSDHMQAILDVNSISAIASTMIQSISKTDIPKTEDGSEYTFVAGKIENETPYYIDTDKLMENIKQEIISSDILKHAKDIESWEEEVSWKYNYKSRPVSRVSIAGKIIERTLSSKKRERQEIELYFQLRLTNLKTGDTVWQSTKFLAKQIFTEQ